MRGIYVLKAFLIVLPPLIVNVFVLVFNFYREYWTSIDEFLSIGGAIFWEVHVDKASECMSVSSDPDVAMLISGSIDNLFLKSFSLVSITSIIG